MRYVSARIDDPATRGFVNFPELQVIIEPDPTKEVWHNLFKPPSYLVLSKMAPKYYLGRTNTDQWDEITGESLHHLLKQVKQVGTTAVKGKGIFVVWELSIDDPEKATNKMPVYSFQFFHADRCLTRTGAGALVHQIDTPNGDGVMMVNGWTSNGDAFNNTGIVSRHVTEVKLVQRDASSLGSFWYAPVDWVARQVQDRTNGHYQLGHGYYGLNRPTPSRPAGDKWYRIVRHRSRDDFDYEVVTPGNFR